MQKVEDKNSVPLQLCLVFFIRELGQRSVQSSVNGDGHGRHFFFPLMRNQKGTESGEGSLSLTLNWSDSFDSKPSNVIL